MRKTKKENGYKLTEKQKSALLPQESKKRVLPAEEEESEERKQLTFDPSKADKIKRRASEQ